MRASENGEKPAPHCRSGYDRILLAAGAPVIGATWYCIQHLDRDITLLIQRVLFGNRVWSRHFGSIPDTLLIFVIIVTIWSYLRYRYLVRQGSHGPVGLMWKMLAIAAPLSFAAKTALKQFFGRITTREWLLTPDDFGFHWFHGSGRYAGFPSGHMIVVSALAAVLWRQHPRCRPWLAGMLLLLGGALLATNYHFLSDIIAGAYAGLLIESLACSFWGASTPEARP